VRSGKDAEVDAIFDETLQVLGHAELFEPLCNLLRRGDRSGCGMTEFSTTATESLYRNCPDGTSPMGDSCRVVPSISGVRRWRSPFDSSCNSTDTASKSIAGATAGFPNSSAGLTPAASKLVMKTS
jgi:hypothetical protein